MSGPVSMAQHISENALRVHPGEPEGAECPGCKAAGLPGRIPCAPRVEALRLLDRVGGRR